MRSKLILGAPSYLGTPGEIIGRSARGVVVKTGDAALEICEVAAVVGGHLTVPQLPDYRVGNRFFASVAEADLAELKRRVPLRERSV